MNLPRLKFLIADVAAMDARIRSILLGDELAFAHSQPQVEALLDQESFDLAIVCERFESRGFEMLRLLAAKRVAMPVACIRLHNALTPPPLPDGYRATVTALGAKALADLRAASLVEFDRIRRVFYRCIDWRTRRLKSNAYTRTLQMAAETLGGREPLAEFLGVSMNELLDWLSGVELPPFSAYCSALDVVAAGPYAEPHQRAPRGENRPA